MIIMVTAACTSIYTSITKVKGKFVIGTNYNPTVLHLKNIPSRSGIFNFDCLFYLSG